MSTYNLGEYQTKITIDSSGLEKGLDKANKGMENTEKKGGNMGKMFAGLALGAVAALGTAIVGIGTAGFKAAQEFQEASNTIRVGTGATGDALKELEESAKTVFKGVPQDMAEVSSALADLNTLTGASGKPLEDLTKQYLDLSRITGESSDQLINTGSKAFNQWGISAEESGDKLDHMFKISQETGIGMNDLMGTMDSHGATMRAMGMDFDQGAIALGNIEASGYSADKAMSGFSKAIANIAAEGKDPAEMLPQLVSDIENMEDSSEATSLAMEVFGKKAGSEMADMIRSGALSVEELEQTIANSSETIEQAGEDTLTLGDRFQMFKDTAMVALIPVGEAMIDIAEKVLPILQAAMEATFEFISGIIDFFRDKIGDMRSDTDGTFSQIKDTVKSIMESVGEIIRVVVEKFTKIWQKYGHILVDFVTDSFNNIQKVVKGVLDIVSGIIDTVLGIITGDWDKAFSGLQKITEGVMSVVEGIISQALNLIKTIVSGALALIQEYFSLAWGRISSTVSSVVSGISSGVRNTLSGLSSRVSSIFSGMLSTARRIFNNIKTAIQNPIRTARDTVRRMIDNIKLAFDFSWSLPKLKVPSVNVEMKTNSWGVPYPSFDIKWHKRGGFFDGANVIGIGEAGKEAAVPLSNEFRQMDPFADAVYERLKNQFERQGVINNHNTKTESVNNTYSLKPEIHIHVNGNIGENDYREITKRMYRSINDGLSKMGRK
ncbi:phage tail tape measure protein [Halalkalibacter sp. APA_J-10(15)]|uniref:phage tail tape measure protein n=1 Tax=Halalkalibacter sp. APA_J-10(15) TaxID=2933805 RepID=UPI001FF6AE8D|nr:phage tail tape measure protein [Halalkalibacter sp. APA_J-10(15)]MCK0470895.1 phage tail tape measure protein [Halalkalibacter sp. APA_J-10(15)]